MLHGLGGEGVGSTLRFSQLAPPGMEPSLEEPGQGSSGSEHCHHPAPTVKPLFPRRKAPLLLNHVLTGAEGQMRNADVLLFLTENISDRLLGKEGALCPPLQKFGGEFPLPVAGSGARGSRLGSDTTDFCLSYHIFIDLLESMFPHWRFCLSISFGGFKWLPCSDF